MLALLYVYIFFRYYAYEKFKKKMQKHCLNLCCAFTVLVLQCIVCYFLHHNQFFLKIYKNLLKDFSFPLFSFSTDDDSDDDLVTDYLTKDVNNYAIPTATIYNYSQKLSKPIAAATINSPIKNTIKPNAGHLKSDINNSNLTVATAATITNSNNIINNNNHNNKSLPLSNNIFFNNHINSNNSQNQNCSINMVPIISVTPHSPGAKYHNVLGE
jgi:hypothetical protein